MLEKLQGIQATMDWSRRSRGKTIGFVPTMGALHAGHQSLIRRAKKENDLAIVSVFVNPLQFGEGEDFARYPRDLEGDGKKIHEAGADALFTVLPEEMYPKGFSTYVVPEVLSDQFEGAIRRNHFRGVATVVLKLFQIVKPDRAYFGSKDAQQLAIIQRMVRDLNLGLEIVSCPTIRDSDGLALSSRNAYLSTAERNTALSLSRALFAANRLFRDGERNAGKILAEAGKELRAASGLSIDYLVLLDPESWEVRHGEIAKGRMLVAARVGQTRLIDNILLGEEIP